MLFGAKAFVAKAFVVAAIFVEAFVAGEKAKKMSIESMAAKSADWKGILFALGSPSSKELSTALGLFSPTSERCK